MKKLLVALLLATFGLTGACATATPDNKDTVWPGCPMDKHVQAGCGGHCEHMKQPGGCPSDCPLGKCMKGCSCQCGKNHEAMKSGMDFMKKHRSALAGQKEHIMEKHGSQMSGAMACTEDCEAEKGGDDPMKKHSLHRAPEDSTPGCREGMGADHMAMMSDMAKKHVEQLMAGAAAPRDPHAMLPGAAEMKSMHTRFAEPLTPHAMSLYRRKGPGMPGMSRVGETMAMIIANAGKAELSDDQSEKVKAVQNDLLKKRIKMNADLRIAELDSMEAIDTRKPNLKKAADSLKKFGTLKAAFDQELLKAFGKIQAILSDEQFDAVRKSVIPAIGKN